MERSKNVTKFVSFGGSNDKNRGTFEIRNFREQKTKEVQKGV
jgi:hypothetical protein